MKTREKIFSYFRFFITTIMVVVLSSFSSFQTIDTNAKMKALFIMGFSKHIEWPQTYKDGNFIIGILGNSNVTSELAKMAISKQAGNQSVEIKNFANVSAISKCHMLIVPPEQSNEITDVLKKVNSFSTLLITEKPGLAKQGSVINLIYQNNKQAFELNKTNAEKYDLKVSTNLATLAVAVY